MKLVLGTVQFGLEYGINNSGGKPSREKVFAVLDKANQVGIDELDTADAYGSSSEVIASYLENYGTNTFKIMSKFIGGNKISFKSAFENSCQVLGLNSIEGYYFHRFEDFISCKEFDYINELKSVGRLKKLAVSLYSIEDLEVAVNSKEIDLIQLPFNVFDRPEEKISLLKKAKANKKLIYVRSAFLQGLFFKNVNALPFKLIPLKENLIQLNDLVNDYEVSMEDLCLKFAVDQDYIDKVIVGVDSVVQLENNIKSLTRDLPEKLVRDVLKIKIDRPDLLNPANWNN